MTQAVLDIDFDFFFDRETPLRETPEKQIWCDPAATSLHGNSEPTCVVEHHEVLMHLDAWGVNNVVYYHLDAHHDMYLDGPLEDIRPGSRAGFINEGNYLAHALRDGIIRHLYSICPDWQSPRQREAELSPKLGAYADRVTFSRFSEARDTISAQTFDRVYYALSPAFTPPRYYSTFAKWSGCTSKLIEQSWGIYRSIVVAGYSSPRFNFFYNLPTVLPANSPCLYQGSRIPDLEYLHPGPNNLVHLSSSPGFATCVGLGLKDKNKCIWGVDFLTGSQPLVYTFFPGEQGHYLDQPLYLYRVAMPGRGVFPVGDVEGFEYGSKIRIPVESCESFPSSREAFERYGVFVACSRDSSPRESGLVAMARQYHHDIEAFFEMPFEAVIRLPQMKPLLHAYLISIAGIAPGSLDPSNNFIWKQLLERIIMPIAFAHSEIHHNGYHGMDHCYDVAKAAGHIALTCNNDPLPPMLAGAVHDICCNGKNKGRYGDAAAERLPLIMNDLSKGFFDGMDHHEVAAAIREQSQVTNPSSQISAYLRDADRLRLAWQRYVPDYFATEEGRHAARLGSYYLQTSWQKYIEGGITEVKVEITNECNLSCPFCHQGFGSKKRRDRLTKGEFRQVLEKASSAGISSLRITGGEPCLHPDLRLFLEMALEFEMHVTLNTNGTALSIDRYLELAQYVSCFKVSLPYAREEDAQQAGLTRFFFQKKIELIATLYAYGSVVEALTIMTPLNIKRFYDFVDLLDPLEKIRWVPLRAEPSEKQHRPVSREDIRDAAAKILHIRDAGRERWSDLQLHLAVPFCVLEDSTVSPVVFSGRQTCGPIQSLTFTPDNHLISCYSERDPLPVSRGENLQIVAWNAPHRHLSSLPDCCQGCMHGYLCMGGCITAYALENTAFGRLDYLADPASLNRNEMIIHG